jgi:hypothetical protein
MVRSERSTFRSSWFRSTGRGNEKLQRLFGSCHTLCTAVGRVAANVTAALQRLEQSRKPRRAHSDFDFDRAAPAGGSSTPIAEQTGTGAGGVSGIEGSSTIQGFRMTPKSANAKLVRLGRQLWSMARRTRRGAFVLRLEARLTKPGVPDAPSARGRRGSVARGTPVDGTKAKDGCH